MRNLCLAALLILCGPNCLAFGDCSAIDLRSDLLGPAWNKGKSPFCNDYSAADLVSQRLGKKVSPLDMALNFNRQAWAKVEKVKESFRETSLIGGSAVGAVERTQDVGGFCLESDFRSEPKIRSENLKEKLDKIQEWAMSSKGSSERDPSGSNKKLLEALHDFFPAIGDSEAAQMRKASTAYDILRNFQKRACRSRLPAKFKMKELYDTKKTDNAKVLEVIDLQLGRLNMVTLYYDANFLLENPVPNASHSSTVVGRRTSPTTGACEYLIRNSWGDCDINHYPYKCENGHIWIPRKTIQANALGYAYIE